VEARQPFVVVFSWPSDGQRVPPSAYSRDRRDAQASGPAFARGLMKLSDFLQSIPRDEVCEGRIHLVAHRMGAYVLRYALQSIRNLTSDDLPRLFDQIILAAADEDNDAYEYDYKLALLPRIARYVTTYFNNHDVALVLSDKTKGNPERLGHDGPRYPHQLPGKVALVDVTDLFTPSDPSGHSYFLDNPRVVQDIKAIISGLSPESIPGRTYVPYANKFTL